MGKYIFYSFRFYLQVEKGSKSNYFPFSLFIKGSTYLFRLWLFKKRAKQKKEINKTTTYEEKGKENGKRNIAQRI